MDSIPPSPFSSPCPPANRGLRPRPRSLTAVPSERKRSSVPPVTALARLRRAGGLLPAERRTPHLYCDRADSGPLAAFSSLCSVGTITRSVPPRSSRRNAPRGPISSRSLRLRFAPAPRSLIQSCYPRGRRGGFAAHAAAAAGLCCGPRYAAIWHANAHQLATSRGPRDEALRNSATPTVGSE